MIEETTTAIKIGPKWTNDHMFPTYEEAITRLEKLTTKWTEDKQENMQTKVRLRANGTFLIKYRKDPAFQKENKKNERGNGKNKSNTKKGKTDVGAGV